MLTSQQLELQVGHHAQPELQYCMGSKLSPPTHMTLRAEHVPSPHCPCKLIFKPKTLSVINIVRYCVCPVDLL